MTAMGNATMSGQARLFNSAVLFVPLALGSCCAFVPCHPGTWIVGSVKGTTGKPISGAQGELFGAAFTSTPEGCFVIHQADALPHVLTIGADGFKPIEEPAKFGHFEVQARLAPLTSNSVGEVVWKELTEETYLRTVANGCQ